MLVKVGKNLRNVIINKRTDSFVMGRVGIAFFKWGKKHDLPVVLLRGEWTEDVKVKLWVKAFIEEYEKILDINPKGISPMHFNESEKKDVIVVNKKTQVTRVSGVARWMLEEHKVWVECHMKNGATYWRRARFKQESRELIEEYLPTCSMCKDRDICNKPCSLDKEVA